MSYRNYVRRIPGLPQRLGELAHQLRQLSARVRQAAAGAVGDLVARTVTDALGRLWGGGRLTEDRPRYQQDDYGWHDDHREYQWYGDESRWEEREDHDEDEEHNRTTARTQLLGLTMQAAGVWLFRRCTWTGAIGVGLLAGLLSLVGSRFALAGLGVAEAAGEVLVLNHLIASGSRALDED
jgi:hypothetical protein